MIPRAFIVLATIGGLATAAATAAPDRLVRAYQRGDADQVARLGSTLSAAGLSTRLAITQSRMSRLAAAAAARHADDAWVLLVPLAARASGPDRPIAAVAARSAARITDALDRDRAIDLDIPDDALRMRLILWRAIAASPGRWPDVRVHAMSVARRLRDAMPKESRDISAYDVSASLADPEPEVRRAALELLPAQVIADHANAIAARVRSDADAIVAIVAAQILCSPLPQDTDAAAAAVRALGDAGMDRLRTLLGTPNSLPPAAIIGAARCLAADDNANSARLLRTLTVRGPRNIRAALRRLPRTRPRPRPQQR